MKEKAYYELEKLGFGIEGVYDSDGMEIDDFWFHYETGIIVKEDFDPLFGHCFFYIETGDDTKLKIESLEYLKQYIQNEIERRKNQQES